MRELSKAGCRIRLARVGGQSGFRRPSVSAGLLNNQPIRVRNGSGAGEPANGGVTANSTVVSTCSITNVDTFPISCTIQLATQLIMELTRVQQQQSVAAISHQGRAFNSIHDIRNYVQSFSEEERYDVIVSFRDQFMALHQQLEGAIIAYMDYVETLPAFRARDRRDISWEPMRATVREAKSKVVRIGAAQATVEKHWGNQLEQTYDTATWSYTMWEQVRKAALKVQDPARAKRLLDQAIYYRITHPGRGIVGSIDPQPVDFRAIADQGSSGVRSLVDRDLTADEMNRASLQYSDDRALVRTVVPPLGTGRATTVFEEPESSRASERHRRVASDVSMRSAGRMSPAGSPLQSRPTSPTSHRDEGTIISSVGSTLTVLESDDMLKLALEAGLGDSVDAQQEASVHVADPAFSGGTRRSTTYGMSVPPESSITAGPGAEQVPSDEHQKADRCRCSAGVSTGLRTRIGSSATLSEDKAIRLLGETVAASENNSVCYAHWQKVASKVGLQTKRLSEVALTQRLRFVYNNRLKLDKLKTDQETYQYFRKDHRPARPSDGLGIYRLEPLPISLVQIEPVNFLKRVMNKEAYDAWLADGTIVVPGMFSWLLTHELWPVMREEIEMYHWHIREIGGRSNLGWLRNCLYSTLQQIVRQDLRYYATYVGLRPDKRYTLMSYPYYMKSAKRDDSTFFRHIDLNIPDLLRGRGANQIQGTVSFTDETSDNCTELIFGMQHKLGEWWGRVHTRGLATDGYLHRITDAMFTATDATELGVEWKDQPCPAGAARISLPHLPHGAKGPSVGERITVMPWYVAVGNDGETLEVQEAGNRNELAVAHRDGVAARCSPSGLANRYGKIPFRFPATTEVTGVSAISDAIVGRRQWSSPAVQREVSVLFGTNDTARNTLMYESRLRAMAAAKQALADSQAAERLHYGKKSYYYCKERGISSVPDDDTAPGEDEQLMHPAAPGSPAIRPTTSRPHSPLTIRSRSPGGGSGDGFQSLGEVLRR